jgi:transcription elongation factor Elf1
MPTEFATVIAPCATEDCPNFGTETVVPVRLDEHGCVPQIVCGVCSLDIVSDPHPPVEETPE